MDFFWPVQNNNVSKLIAAYWLIVLYSMEPPALCWVADYELDTGVRQKKNDMEEGWETVTKLKGSFYDSTKLGEYILQAYLIVMSERERY